jgi:hypothetical protein
MTKKEQNLFVQGQCFDNSVVANRHVPRSAREILNAME